MNLNKNTKKWAENSEHWLQMEYSSSISSSIQLNIFNSSFTDETVRIHEFIQAPKALGSGHSVKGEKKGTHGLHFSASVDLIDGPFLDMLFRGKATHSAEPSTYEGNFFIDQERVRGIGHNYVGRRNFRAKKRIPEGWHQNIVDPTKPTTHDAYNRHDPLPDFQPTDFEDFTRKVAAMWTIDLDWEGGLL